MSDPAIDQFFQERKEAWLKKNLKAGMSEMEVREKQQECEEVFALKNWLSDAAQRIESRALASHPSKFSHPSTGVGKKNKANGTYVTPVLFLGHRSPDGFLRTGNVTCEEIDSVGNAAELDVEDFLRLKLNDGVTLLDHIEQKTASAKALLCLDGYDFEQLRTNFLAVKRPPKNIVTNSKIKQVYFLVGEGEYHQLSILTHSAYLFEQRRRIDAIRFSEQAKEAREKRRNNQLGENYQEIYHLTTIGYGGTKPANISVLNNQNAGKAHLLLSMPPETSPRNVQLPTRNFFGEALYPKQLQVTFQAFHRLLSAGHNNVNIRKGRDYRIQEYLDQLILKMWQVRKAFVEQEHSRPEGLPGYQKIWLFPEHEQERADNQAWLAELIQDATRYFNASYKRVLGSTAFVLGDTEHFAFAEVIEQNKEALL